MNSKKLACIFLCLSVACFSSSADDNYKLDSNGCRQLSDLPEPGVHPRVFFTKDEYPQIRKRLQTPEFARVFGPIRKRVIANIKSQWKEFSKLDLTEPTDEQIIEFFKSDEGRNINWGLTSLSAVLSDDAETKRLMINVIVNYSKIILASRERASQIKNLKPKNNALVKSLQLWTHDRFDVGVSWTLGASGFAISYDVLFDDMNEQQRQTVRAAIAAGTKGRRSYGNGMPRGFASSNHYGYHGDLAVLLASIENEPGFDAKTWQGIEQVLKDYWEIAFTAAGACREDGYGPNLGLRAGGRGLMVLARRGYNIFSTEKFRNYLNYVALEYDPFPGGHFNGGASGGPYPELYPTSTILCRYMYPESPVANFNFRQLMGEDYERRIRWQGWLDFMIYGADWRGPKDRASMLKTCNLPLSKFYPVRGKFICRSDWSNDAMYATLDARPDAHLIGHDKSDRGNFSMSALGRVWAFSGDFSQWDSSRENSLVHIDGKAQAWKAPGVRFLWHSDGLIAGAVADLKYAYDWQWSPPWPKWGKTFDSPWEPETRSPIDLGWPKDLAEPAVCPDSIHGSQTGYNGRNNLHRRPYNPVQKAQRSLFLVRTESPFLLICDDICKDDSEHRYDWYLQLPTDLERQTIGRNRVILKEPDGDRRLLILFLQDSRVQFRFERFVAKQDLKRDTQIRGKRLIAARKCIEPAFRVVLFPFREGQKLPEFQWNSETSNLTFELNEKSSQFRCNTSDKAGTKLVLEKQN